MTEIKIEKENKVEAELLYGIKGFMYNNQLFCMGMTPETLEKTAKFQFRSDDIIMSSYPKSGTIQSRFKFVSKKHKKLLYSN